MYLFLEKYIFAQKLFSTILVKFINLYLSFCIFREKKNIFTVLFSIYLHCYILYVNILYIWTKLGYFDSYTLEW